MFNNTTPIDNINIAILGCVSAGKSTILNAMFCQDFSQCKIKRTTMIPAAFVETESTNAQNPENINKIISEKNMNIIKDTESGKPLDLKAHGIEMVFNVEKLDIKISKDYNITLYDTPGLNDARTKNEYYRYLKDNFKKFNIIMFIVNIESGLNTSDEMDIIKFISENISIQKQNKKNIKLLVVANKSDEMQILKGQTNPEIVDEELKEMFDQIQRTVIQVLHTNNVDESLIGVVPICGIDAHVYRMIRAKGSDYKLSPSQISRIGIREEGNKFRKMDAREQNKVIQKIISNKQTVKDAITLSGFTCIDYLLAGCINKDSHTFVASNIEEELNKINELTLSNLIPTLIQKLTLLSKIKKTNPVYYKDNLETICTRIDSIIETRINSMSDVHLIIEEYKKIKDSILKNKIKIGSTLFIGEIISELINFHIYPTYIIKRINELVSFEFSLKNIPIKKLHYFLVLKHIRGGYGYIGKYNLKTVDELLSQLTIKNSSELCKFNFSDLTDELCKSTLEIFDSLKHAPNFMVFLRSFMICCINSNPQNIVKRSLFYKKHGEIQLHEYIIIFISSRQIDTKCRIDASEFCNNITIDPNDKELIFDNYYVNYAKQIDPSNFMTFRF